MVTVFFLLADGSRMEMQGNSTADALSSLSTGESLCWPAQAAWIQRYQEICAKVQKSMFAENMSRIVSHSYRIGL